MGELIPLQVDHVDGNADNNDEENLRLLCANCHTLTPTYGALNKDYRESLRNNKRRKRYAEKSRRKETVATQYSRTIPPWPEDKARAF